MEITFLFLIPHQIRTLIGLGGQILLTSFDRIAIFILYRYFQIKVHDQNLQNILKILTVALGIVFSSIFLVPTFYEGSLIANIVWVTFIVILGIFVRFITLKSNYMYFPLDDDFYLDKDGHDIRKK